MNAKHLGSTLDSLFEELGEMGEVSTFTQKKLTESFEDLILEVVPHGTIRAQVRPATLPLPEWED